MKIFNKHFACSQGSTIFRDRPFNLQGRLWFFVSFRNFFPDNTRVRIFVLFCRANFFLQNSTLGYMTKTLNQIIIFFPPPKSEYFFLQHWESETHNPPPPFKLNGRSLNSYGFHSLLILFSDSEHQQYLSSFNIEILIFF